MQPAKLPPAPRRRRADFGSVTTRSLIVLSLGLAWMLSGCGEQPTDGTSSVGEEGTASPGESVSDAAFREAAQKGQAQIVRKAINGGVDVNATDADGRTALLLASFDGHTDVVQLLLDNNALVNHRDAAGRTALMYASTGPHEETVSVLLGAGAQPDIADRGEEFTALMFAAAEGQLEVAQTLLGSGADPSLQDIDGDTAGDFAANNGHDEIAALLAAAIQD